MHVGCLLASVGLLDSVASHAARLDECTHTYPTTGVAVPY